MLVIHTISLNPNLSEHKQFALLQSRGGVANYSRSPRIVSGGATKEDPTKGLSAFSRAREAHCVF